MTPTGERLLELTRLRYETLPLLLESMQPDSTGGMGDPISRLVKCHLLSEVALDKLLELAFAPNGAAVLSGRLSYSQKLRIASRCELAPGFDLLPDFIVGSLKSLNKLRNRLAHEIHAEVTEEEVMALFAGHEEDTFKDLSKMSVSELIYNYTPFLFGNMLPKYERIDDE